MLYANPCSYRQEAGPTLLSIELAAYRWLSDRFHSERGQTLAEYGLIMSVISIAVVVLAIVAFRTAINQSFHEAWHCLRLETQWCE